jgi:putative redox protein
MVEATSLPAAWQVRFRLILDPALEPHRPAVTERVERSPVRSTLSQPLFFEPATARI